MSEPERATGPSGANPAAEALDPDIAEAWPMLRRRLANLLNEGSTAAQFVARLDAVNRHVRHLAETRQEDSLFVLVQMLTGREFGYSATHALMACALCHMIAPLTTLDDDTREALTRAALTMNIAMKDLHDVLSRQAQPLYEDQRLQIKSHPTQGCAMLKLLGVTDDRWLDLVQDHHESPDGTGYPGGKTDLSEAQQLLRMSDLFIAKISPRASRRGLAPRLAVGSIYLDAQARHNAMGAIFARQVGMYPPGSYVRLRNHEIAVVVRRGEKVNTPLTMAIVGVDGLPLSVPDRRDTSLPQFAVTGHVAPEDIKVRPEMSKLLKRIG